MKIGFCSSVDSCVVLKELGYDFIEMPVAQIMGNDYRQVGEKVKKVNIECTAFNCFIPARFSIIDCYVHGKKELTEYYQKAIDRVADLGGKIIVFGSGAARYVPAGFENNTATDIIASFVDECADYAEQYDITIAVEHLNKDETNILNSVNEVASFVNKIDKGNVKILVDTYHMLKEKEDIAILGKVINDVAHIHIADLEGRSYPHKNIEFYMALSNILKNSHYKGAVSVECAVGDLAFDAKMAIKFIENNVI